ncbi:SixA phosphatase family protein [Chitinimonas lacunae]|uniref:SixA phosphatase family protein n=1 Tax=Chitinimonas lacunae TaxID=1963018 RepID=A0ABV8MQ27_9NEIS
MDLILWRHAEAEDGADDMARALTGRGRKQAAAMAGWLRSHLPPGYRVVASEAVRARQTAEALDPDHRVDPRLNPDLGVTSYLDAIGWPDQLPEVLLIVAHQPTLGQLAARLLGGQNQEWSVRKGAIWWFQGRQRGGQAQMVLRTVLAPEQID